jgi:tetratricopeptide (TPR) repeat protein
MSEAMEMAVNNRYYKMKGKVFVFSVFAIFVCGPSTAQDSVTLNDVKNITSKAEFMVSNLNSLLNAISSTGSDNNDIRQMISGSMGEGVRKIFLNSKITIADDISSPNFRNSSSSHDVSVDQYLNDFNTLYSKSEAHSVVFGNIRSSNVKRGKKNLFVKVYFTSFFKNKCKASLDTPYVLTNREAEIFLKRGENNKWITYISRISFLNPLDTINDFSDDIALIRTPNTRTKTAATENLTKLQIQQNLEREMQESEIAKENEKYEAETKLYNGKLEEGDDAYARHEYKLALDAYIAAKNLRPYDITPRARIDRLLKEQQGLQTSEDSKFHEYIDGATLEEKKRNYQSAINDYHRALEIKPQEEANYNPRIQELTEKIRILSELNEQYKAGLYKEAVKGYSDLIRKDKTNSDLYLGRGKCYKKVGESSRSHNEQLKNYYDALDDFTKSYNLDNSNLETIRNMADLYKRMGKYQDALREYKMYLLVNKEDVSVYEEISDLHFLVSGNVDDGIRDLNTALNIDPNNMDLYYERGILYQRKKDYVSAIADFQKVLAARPRDKSASVLIEMGSVYLDLKKPDSAFSYMNKAYRIDSTSAQVMYGMAGCYYVQGNPDESLRWIEKAFQQQTLDPVYVEQDELFGAFKDDKRFKELKKKYHY